MLSSCYVVTFPKNLKNIVCPLDAFPEKHPNTKTMLQLLVFPFGMQHRMREREGGSCSVLRCHVPVFAGLEPLRSCLFFDAHLCAKRLVFLFEVFIVFVYCFCL